MESTQRDLTSNFGPMKVNWPMAAGYYGGIIVLVTAGAIEAPLGVFIACVPFFKLINRPNATLPELMVSQALQGAAKPVGGDGEAAIQLVGEDGKPESILALAYRGAGREVSSILADARKVARGG